MNRISIVNRNYIYSKKINHEDSQGDALANSEDPGEMPHNAAFQLGLQCLLRIKRSSKKNCFEIITCDPSKSTINYPMFIVSNQVEEHTSL